MKSHTLFLKSLKEKPRSSGAATVLAFPNRNRVLPEFCIQPMTAFEGRANLFASFLLALWVPVQPNERINFLPLYQLLQNNSLSEASLGRACGSVTQIDPSLLAPLWAQGQTQNLGALLFLNCLMSRNVDQDTLGVVTSPITSNPFFTQKLSSFWFNYFQYPRTRHIFSHKLTDNFSYALKQLSQPQHDWWQRTGLYSNNDIKDENLLLYSAFEAIFRVLLTPDYLIEQMIKTIFGPHFATQDFEYHVKTQINDVRANIFKCLTREQKNAWETMIRTDGMRYLEAFKTSLSNFKLYKNDPLFDAHLKTMQQEMQDFATSFISAHPTSIKQPPCINSIDNARAIMDEIQLLNDDIQHLISDDEDDHVDSTKTASARTVIPPEQDKICVVRKQRSLSIFKEGVDKNNSHDKENMHKNVHFKIDKNHKVPGETVRRGQVNPFAYTS